MAKFEALTYKINNIEPHPYADRLDIAHIGDGIKCVVGKNSFKQGQFVVHIPEDAILPPALLEEMGLTGMLAGKSKNRVRPRKIKGILSEGILYPCYGPSLGMKIEIVEGLDFAPELGLRKYDQPIPASMGGEVQNLGREYTLSYDIENIYKYRRVIPEGRDVVMTEKIHGSWCCLGFHPDAGPIVTSKGLSKKGLAFKVGGGRSNIYLEMWELYGKIVMQYYNAMVVHSPSLFSNGNSRGVYMLGEVYGRGVQDMNYGLDGRDFRLFDVVDGDGISQYFKPGVDFNDKFIGELGCVKDGVAVMMKGVPEVYRGPFSMEVLERETQGKSRLYDGIREGVVVRPIYEKRDEKLGRVILKSINPAYKARKQGTEYT